MKCSFLAVMLLTFSLISGCKKSASDQAAQVSPFKLSFTIVLNDEGDQRAAEQSGMTVSVENSDPLISGITNSESTLVLDLEKAHPGMLALVFSRPGYPTFRRYVYKKEDGIHDVVGTEIQQPKMESTSFSLSKKSTVTVNSIQTSVVNNKLVLHLNTTIPPGPGEKFVRFFYSASPDLAFDNVPKDGRHMSAAVPVSNGNFSTEFCISCLYTCTDFKKGDTVYITAYGDSKYGCWYTDLFTGQVMMPSVNTAHHPAPVSFVMP